MTTTPRPQAYLVGSGIASLATAVFLIRDARYSGEDIHILEELPLSGEPWTGGETHCTGM